MERFLENAMYASRWLLAPVYFGLSLALVALALKFFQEIIHVLPNIFSMAESDLILVLLSLVDMTLVGGLLVMVMFSVLPGIPGSRQQMPRTMSSTRTPAWDAWASLSMSSRSVTELTLMMMCPF